MKNLYHQTKQAFLFSLVFYIGSIILLVMKVSIAPILFSMSLLVSMIWVILVVREVFMSNSISSFERILIAIFVVTLNIVGGIVYFSLLRNRVISKQNIKS